MLKTLLGCFGPSQMMPEIPVGSTPTLLDILLRIEFRCYQYKADTGLSTQVLLDRYETQPQR